MSGKQSACRILLVDDEQATTAYLAPSMEPSRAEPLSPLEHPQLLPTP